MPWPPATEPFMNWIKQYPFQFYHVIGLAGVDQTDSAYFWDRESITKHMSTPTSVMLFRRK
jgi:hypothetical protein